MDKTLLKIVADNPALLQVLREVIESKFSVDDMKEMSDDAVLGQMVRARLVGLRLVSEAFKEIERHKSTPERPVAVNKAR